MLFFTGAYFTYTGILALAPEPSPPPRPPENHYSSPSSDDDFFQYAGRWRWTGLSPSELLLDLLCWLRHYSLSWPALQARHSKHKEVGAWLRKSGGSSRRPGSMRAALGCETKESGGSGVSLVSALQTSRRGPTIPIKTTGKT